MPSIDRILEASLYATLNFLPYVLLAIAPFLQSLRFSRRTTVVLLLLATCLQMPLYVLDLWVSLPPWLLTVIGVALDFSSYLILVKANVGKLTFMLLLLSNVANLLSALSKCLEGVFFPAFATEGYHLSHSLLLLACNLVVLPLLYLYMRRYFTADFAQSKQGSHWRYLWLIPLTFYFIWFYHLYSDTHGSSDDLLLLPEQAFFLFSLPYCLRIRALT